MRMDQGNGSSSVGQKAAENPGKTAVFSLLTTPLAMRAGSVALRWARRNPGLALTVAAGALVWYGLKARRQAGAGSASGGDDDDSFDFPGAAHGATPGYGRGAADGGARSPGGDASSASSL
jgi:hypothetical protein